MSNKKTNKFLLVLVMCIILSLGCIMEKNNDHNNESEKFIGEKIYYNIKVQSNLSINFSINLPIFVNNNEVSEMNSEFRIVNGNGKIDFENTIHGPSMNITSNESFEIRLNTSIDKNTDLDIYPIHLSLFKEDSIYANETFCDQYWIYVECDKNITLEIDLYCEWEVYLKHSYGNEGNTIRGKIEVGWNLMDTKGWCYTT